MRRTVACVPAAVDGVDRTVRCVPERRILRTEQYDFSVASLATMLEKKELAIPEFQRRYVRTDRQASRLIESLIIQCPIPVIYMNQERDESFSGIESTPQQPETNAAVFVCEGRTVSLHFTQLEDYIKSFVEDSLNAFSMASPSFDKWPDTMMAVWGGGGAQPALVSLTCSTESARCAASSRRLTAG